MSGIPYHTKVSESLSGCRYGYNRGNETKPQPRIWRSASEASDHLIELTERG